MKYLAIVFVVLIALSFSFRLKHEKRERIYRRIECDSSYAKMNKEIPVNFKKLADLLIENQAADQFEADSIFGFIKIGDFWNDKSKYAIIINIDDETGFHIFHFLDHKWKEVYYQENEKFNITFQIIPKFADYNFDGILDLAFCISRSNGAGIESVLLWLKLPNGFKFIDNFSQIGTPKIIIGDKIIKSFTACCVFSEISVQKYKWINNNLTLIDSTYIMYYPNGSKGMEYYQLEDGELKLKKSTKSVNKHFIKRLLKEFEQN